MKLIIREYLSSLKERKELDALLPDLLSQMGLNVFSKPSIGPRQYGVDVAAFGRIEKGENKVYLFTIKSGNLGRSDWNSGSPQDVKPSLDDIIDTYIPTHIPKKYKDKNIEICICVGGDIEQAIRLSLSQYEEKYSTDKMSFSEWTGEELSNFIEAYLLKEDLLPPKFRSKLRKSLALIDEPKSSYKYFVELVSLILESDKPEVMLRSLRQLYISIWIIYAWSRLDENIESAYIISEISLLNAWEITKKYTEKRSKNSSDIRNVFNAIQLLHLSISEDFINNKILNNTNKLYGISSAVNSSCHVDVNLKLFDILGRISLFGIWSYLLFVRTNDKKQSETLVDIIIKYQNSIIELIYNNPILFTPYKDDQIIDITLAVWFLSIFGDNTQRIYKWLKITVDRIYFMFKSNDCYPCILRDYNDLILHPKRNESYKKEVTSGSVLYPIIATFSVILDFDDVYLLIQKLQKDFLAHCNFQAWYPDEDSEIYFYNNKAVHGSTLSNIKITDDKMEFINKILSECDKQNSLSKLSAANKGPWPLILIACRHYRLPIPLDFIKLFIANPQTLEVSEEKQTISQRIYKFILEHGEVSLKKISKETKYSPQQVQNSIQNLLRKDTIERIERGIYKIKVQK